MSMAVFQKNIFIKTGGWPDSTRRPVVETCYSQHEEEQLSFHSAQALGSNNTVIFFSEVLVLTYGLKKC